MSSFSPLYTTRNLTLIVPSDIIARMYHAFGLILVNCFNIVGEERVER